MNTKQKGDLAVAKAIAFYIEAGHEVLLPVGDRLHYDLAVDVAGSLQRVQVKYAGNGIAYLRTDGGNRSRKTNAFYSDESFDRLFVYEPGVGCYDIPWSEITARSALTTSAWKQYLS